MIFTPIDVSDDKLENVIKHPAKFKHPVSEQFLKPVPFSACQHYDGFEVDVKGGKCTCQKCGEEVTPMYVLEHLMKKESRWMQTFERYRDEMKRLDERSKTKCRSCGAMTPISRS